MAEELPVVVVVLDQDGQRLLAVGLVSDSWGERLLTVVDKLLEVDLRPENILGRQQLDLAVLG